MRLCRVACALALTVAWLLAGAGPATADPAGPTDFLSEVTEIEPETPGVEVDIVGGDSFVLLTVEAGISVDVTGYQGEPYLRFRADGTVEENQASPSKYLNEDRYGISDVPDGVDADADPDWKVVADNGSYAWHDHRTHWMNSAKPPGKGPGDQVAEGVIPLVVDGVEIDVTVSSFWQDPPSAFPVALGIAVGILAGYAAIRRRGRVVDVLIVGCAFAAVVVGIAAYTSVPAETGPSWTLWVVPATALVVALVAGFRRTLLPRSRWLLLLVAALELVAWGVSHWDWLWPAVLPTSLPFWLDRFVGAGVLVSACGAAIAVLLGAATPGGRISFRSR